MDALVAIDEIEESDNVGSYNHSKVQANLAFLLKRLSTYTVLTELSLDASQLDPNQFNVKGEIKPDVCIYPKRGLSRPYDILRMSEMPLLVIEILSPRQGTYDILEKFGAYFALGIPSCWLVDPATEIVAVYSAPEKHQSFSNDEVVDHIVDLRLSLAEIFE